MVKLTKPQRRAKKKVEAMNRLNKRLRWIFAKDWVKDLVASVFENPTMIDILKSRARMD